MKKNILLMGITILAAARTMCAADVHDFSCDGEKTPVFSADEAASSQSAGGREFPEYGADTLTLRTVVVNANLAQPSRSALRLATIDEEKLRQRGASRTYPELLKGLPGLYATSESGSYGDAKLNIRGFGQENISVLLNGIPISGLVTGGMYWNNWMGLADATWAVQVQKGVGASMLSDGSVGGSVNIITESTSERFSAEAGFYGSAWDSHSAGTPAGGQASPGNSGPFKGYLKLGSGRLRHGWSMNLMASYVGGNGYVESTSVSSFAYMFTLAKSFGDEHRLIFTSLGSPENHEQRSSRLSAAEVGEQAGSGKLAKIAVPATTEKSQSVKMTAAFIEELSSSVKKAVMHVYNPSGENVKLSVSIKYSKKTTLIDLASVELKPGMNEIELPTGTINWTGLGKAESMTLIFGDTKNEAARTIYLGDLTVYNE